jgi:hypothetical protein
MTDTDSPGSPADRPVPADAPQQRAVRRLAVMFTSAIGAAVVILVATVLGAPLGPLALSPTPRVTDTAPSPTGPATTPPASAAFGLPDGPGRRLANTIVVTTTHAALTTHPPVTTTTRTTTQPTFPSHHHKWPTIVFTPPGR